MTFSQHFFYSQQNSLSYNKNVYYLLVQIKNLNSSSSENHRLMSETSD